MKRFIALILVAIMCFTFAACDKNSNDDIANDTISETTIDETENTTEELIDEIVGEWKCPYNNTTLTFHENKTGIFNTEYGDKTMKWKFDNELSCYMIVLENGTTISTPITISDAGLKMIKFESNFYITGHYYPNDENYEKAKKAEYQRIYNLQLEQYSDEEKIELGETVSIYDSHTITFNNITINDNYLYLNITFKQLRSDTWYKYFGFNGSFKMILDGGIVKSQSSTPTFDKHHYNDNPEIIEVKLEPAQTIDCTVQIPLEIDPNTRALIWEFNIADKGVAGDQWGDFAIDLSEYLN